MCSACFPRPSLSAGASLPSTGSSGASSPASSVLSKRCDFLSPVPPHFVAFARQYLSVHSFCSLLGGRVRRQDLELVTRYSSREFAEEATGSPKFLGNPNHPFARVPATPAGLLSPDHYGAAAWPLSCQQQGLPRWVFRRSIARLPDSLSNASQRRLPGRHARLASGRWSGATGRAFHPQGSAERFQSCILHLIPLSQAWLGAMASTSLASRVIALLKPLARRRRFTPL
jgi:hypothetical protein